MNFSWSSTGDSLEEVVLGACTEGGRCGGCSPTLLPGADKAPVLLGTARHVMLPVPPSELLNFITGSQEYFPTNNFPYEPLRRLSQGWAAGDREGCRAAGSGKVGPGRQAGGVGWWGKVWEMAEVLSLEHTNTISGDRTFGWP